MTAASLARHLNTWQLWGIAVGLVISGEYFGWSYGWAYAGTLGFLLTTALVALLYTTFIFSFTELTTAIPHAGGPFAYSLRAFGQTGGYVAGYATLVEFVFAPPAIALAMGAYLHVQFAALSPQAAALVAYGVFMGLNLLGVSIAATFELLVTVLAIGELLLFMAVVAPGFHWQNFIAHGFAGSDTPTAALWPGVLKALPFGIWFFLAIEGVAMAAEEVKQPARAIPRAYIGGILTLVALAFGVMVFAGGVGDWRLIANINDPLPQAMQSVVGANSGWLHVLVFIGLLGLIASFHGIILGYSRQIFALARAGFLPKVLARVNPRWQTPHWAILAGGVVGMVCVSLDDRITFDGQSLTATLVTMSAIGALSMYAISMAALLRLRLSEPHLPRSFKAPCYPWFPLFALIASLLALIAIALSAVTVFLSFLVVGVSGWLWVRFGLKPLSLPHA
jgi:ethanolamine permease